MKTGSFELFSNAVSQLIKAMQFLKSRKMAEYDLKGTTYLCLCQIYESESGLNAGELAERGEIDKAQVSRCVSELTEKGFIYRDDRDGRRYKQKYCLTEAGKIAAQDIVNSVSRIQNAISKGISDSEMEQFFGVLNTLCENFAELLQTERGEF